MDSLGLKPLWAERECILYVETTSVLQLVRDINHIKFP